MNNSNLKNIGVIGCGIMGQGIIQNLALYSFEVFVHDKNFNAIDRAINTIAKRLNRLVEKKELTPTAAKQAIDRIHIAKDMNELKSSQVIIEAVFESIDLKRAIFKALEEIVADNVILASNTSSLLIASIARDCVIPERVAGMHFFNPVPLMKLVEIVAGPATTDRTTETLLELSRMMGKVPVKVKDAPGFLVNLGGRAFTTEAMRLLHERIATPSQIDYIMRNHAGFRMGPLELADLTGVDVNYPVSKLIYEGYDHDPRLKTSFPHRQLFEAGTYGQKTKLGSYVYSKDGKKIDHDPYTKEAAGCPPLKTAVVAKSHLSVIELLTRTNIEVHSEDDGFSPIIVELYGEDCAAYAARTGCDHKRLLALDMLFMSEQSITLMLPTGFDQMLAGGFITTMKSNKINVITIKDSPGFVAQRIVGMVANLGCEMAHTGIAKPHDIDHALRIGLNYPMGPLEWVEKIGVGRCYEIIKSIQDITRDDRYRPSQWLRQRALLKLKIHSEDDIL